MLPPRPSCLIITEAPAALLPLCGISILERLLRTLQRLDFKEATVSSSSLALVRERLERPSWARAELQVEFHERSPGPITVAEILAVHSLGNDQLLFLPGDFYYDARLLGALADAQATTLLVDSSPPSELEILWDGGAGAQEVRFNGAALITRDWLSRQNSSSLLPSALAEAGDVARVDAATASDYLRDQRAHVRPVFFPAPTLERRRLAERVVQQTAQKGTLDIPAMVHAPIETWLVSKLWHTKVRPNHLSFITMLVGLTVTMFYASGWLGLGVVIALAIGVLDGLDGKLARTKVETTELGKWEHEVDYLVESTWWPALAFYFASTNAVPHAWLLWAVLFACDLLDRASRGWVKARLNRNLDDVTVFDRLVRRVGARRNIYTWILAIGLLLGAPAGAFVVLCWWGIATAMIHLLRALQIWREPRVAASTSR